MAAYNYPRVSWADLEEYIGKYHGSLRQRHLDLQRVLDNYAQPLSKGSSGLFQGFERDGGVLRIKKSVDRRPGGMHFGRHFGFGQALVLHLLLDLVGQNPLGRRRLNLSQDALASKEGIKIAANIFMSCHQIQSFFWLPASCPHR